MPRVWLGRARALGAGRDPHPAHQGGHVLPADAHALEVQQIPEQPAAGKGILEMQGIHLAHIGAYLRRE